MWPSSLRPASPDLPGVGIDHQRHVGKPPPRRHTVRSATHSRFGAGSPNRCWTRSAGRTAAGSAIVVLRVLPRVAPDRPKFGHQPLDGAARHRDPLAVKRQPHTLRAP